MSIRSWKMASIPSPWGGKNYLYPAASHLLFPLQVNQLAIFPVQSISQATQKWKRLACGSSNSNALLRKQSVEQRTFLEHGFVRFIFCFFCSSFSQQGIQRQPSTASSLHCLKFPINPEGITVVIWLCRSFGLSSCIGLIGVGWLSGTIHIHNI